MFCNEFGQLGFSRRRVVEGVQKGESNSERSHEEQKAQSLVQATKHVKCPYLCRCKKL